MAARACPQCMTILPITAVVAYSDALVCPKCRATLEVSTGSRLLATAAGLLAGWLVWRWAHDSFGMLGWVMPMLYGFLVFSFVTALILMFVADLRFRPAEPVVEAALASHSAAHH